MNQLFSQFSKAGCALLTVALLGVALFAVGCGDGSSSATLLPTPTPAPTAAPASTVQLRVGDAPVDQLLNFEVTILSPVVATLSSGEKANAVLGNNRIELSHTAGKLEPLLNITLPQGTYKTIDITLADPAVTYVYTRVKQQGDYFGSNDVSAPELVSQDFPGNQTVTIHFDPPVTFGSDASIVNLDVNLANSLVFNPNDSQEITGVTFTPASFTFTKKAIAAADKQQDKDGELESVWGTVSAVSGSSIVLNAGQSGAVLQIATSSTTKFHDSLKGINDTLGRLIEVEGFTQANGTMLATEVELLAGNTGASIEGVVLDAGDSMVNRNALSLGHQANSFTMLAQDSVGNGTRNDDVGWTFTVHTDYLTNAAYEVDYGKCDWSQLNAEIPGPQFPFDSTHLFPGQRVGVVTSSALPNADFSHFTATRVYLEQQAVTGTIVYYHAPAASEVSSPAPDNSTWFVLALPPDSYVRALSGRSFVLVYQGPATDVEFLPTNTDKTIGVGTIARVRGLLFAFANWYPRDSYSSVSHDGGTLTMISRRITEQPPTVDVPAN
jgi:hypothetical protein